MSLVEFHRGLSNAAMFYCIIMAVWGFISFFRRQGVSSGYFGAVVIAEILFAAQGVIGLILWFGVSTFRPGWVHWLYGIVLLMGVPVVYAYTKGKHERPEMLLYSVAFLILIFITMRAMVTAGA
jgi:hypothetical protein